MAIFVHNGSDWQVASQPGGLRPYVHDGTGWQPVTEVYVHNGAGWQLAYQFDNTAPTVATYTVTGQSNANMRFAWSGGALVADSESGVASAKIQAQYTPFGGVGEGWADVKTLSQAEWEATSGSFDFTPPTSKRYQYSGNFGSGGSVVVNKYYMGFRVVAVDAAGNTSTTSEVKAFTKPYGTIYIVPSGADSYQSGWKNLTVHAVRSGDTSGDGVSDYEYGCYFYGTRIADNCLGYAPNSGNFHIQRYLTQGVSGTWNMYLHDKTTNTGGGATLSGTAAAISVSGSDYETDFPMPSGWLSPLAAGTARGLAIDSTISGRVLYNYGEKDAGGTASTSGRLWLTFS